MKTMGIKKKLFASVLGLSLLLGIGLTSASVVQAQWQNRDWQRERDYQREQLRRQREWEREQRRRQRDNDRYDRRNNDDWRYGRNNDDWRYGNGGSFDLRQTALNAGYNEGIKEGRKDRNNNDRFDYRDEEDYRNANTDYQSRFGNRELYRQYFRQGFVNGYTDGYRGY